MNHLMIDIETLSIKDNAVIASVAAVFFNPYDGKIGKTYNQTICTALSHIDGFETDQATLDWWLKQDQSIQDLTLYGTAKPQEVMLHLKDFIKQNADPKNLKVWANSPSFDLVKLRNHFDRYEMTTPWQYYNERDVRTLKNLFKDNNITGLEPDQSKNEHNALSDCLNQVKMVSQTHWVMKNLVKDAQTLTEKLEANA